jgi:hypothetical protein
MGKPLKPDYKEAEKIHSAVMELLREEEDSKGDLKNTGEAKALNKMRKTLENEIARDATEFLKAHGYNGYGLRAKPKRRK